MAALPPISYIPQQFKEAYTGLASSNPELLKMVNTGYPAKGTETQKGYFRTSDLFALIGEGWRGATDRDDGHIDYSTLYNPATGEKIKTLPASGSTAATRAGGSSTLITPGGKTSRYTSSVTAADMRGEQPGGTTSTRTPTAQGMVSRDAQDNFYVDGRKIELPEFKSLGINADFVPRGSSVSLAQAKSGAAQTGAGGGSTGGAGTGTGAGGVDLSGLPPEYQALYTQLDGYLKRLEEQGKSINPNIEITPEKIAEFTKQAEKEINPYFQTQAALFRDSFLKELGYAEDEVMKNEQSLEKKYGTQVRQIGEQAAESGFAQSGLRKRTEQDVATDTQRQIDDARRQLSKAAGRSAATFAQQYGGSAVPKRTLAGSPEVGAGELNFSRGGQKSPYYQLSDDVYSGLVGEQEFARRGSVQSRTAQLEEAFRQQQANKQQRTLTL